ncbi:MAG: NAD(P)-binding domain-containing protein [Propionicimonas sp.]|nr:NAD(P)-binding domain-containing protein [Propionicimonas sp.]
MTAVTIIGSGTMGRAIQAIAVAAGATVQSLSRADTGAITGEVVVLAVPYPSLDDVLARYGPQLAGKVVVDITNPRDPSTGDWPLPADTSGAELLAARLPGSIVLKAFNTTPADRLAAVVARGPPGTGLVAGDERHAKQRIMSLWEGGGVRVVDAGPLSRARALERETLAERTSEAAVDTSG